MDLIQLLIELAQMLVANILPFFNLNDLFSLTAGDPPPVDKCDIFII
ncbi:hypothetical protein JHJ32_06855 [Parapedobacter sp. ISTM3]|uniref:Uncharacterized protein n=1 Tax=Parapedobacter luteus TaxID=623280 RepID=A0A1T5CJF0_9SPHI|nr:MULTISPECIES: hypothetical protein [Parapedobacter]MBK1439696.1 hypothetical protein [Parapedobacter sp. ISTM3]SKB59534.1 hypothetical protein SAMN05660226_02268 [Parapedobacter luteus]